MRLSVARFPTPRRRTAGVAVATAAVLAVGVSGVQPGHADPDDPNCARTDRVETDDGWEFRCVAWHNDPDAGGGDGGSGDEVDHGPPTEGWFSLRHRQDDEVDGLCWEIRWTDSPGYEPPEDREWVTWGDVYEYASERYLTDDENHREMCPGADQADPTGHVRAIWSDMALIPDLDFHVAPDMRALTGMPAYLEIDGERTIELSQQLPEPFDMSLEVAAEASFVVDWGDGGRTGPHESLGGPHPDGDIVYTYAEVSGDEPRTVTVESTWEGSWSAGGFGGPLPPITREDTFGLTVDEMQSVRVPTP
jgi:hypothetical protein